MAVGEKRWDAGEGRRREAVHRAEMSRAKYFLVPIVLAFSFAACEEERKKSNDDDDSGNTAGAGAGATTGGGSGDCAALCANGATAGCESFDPTLCESDCQGFYAQAPPACVGALDNLVSCWTAATPVCGAEGVTFEGCDAQFETYGSCVSNPTTTTTTGGGGAPPTGGACYDGAGECNPMGPPCGAAGSACDVGETGFVCYPDGNTQGLGQACGQDSYCQHGLYCYESVCRQYCCDAVDCGGASCNPIGEVGAIVVSVCL